MPSFGAKLKQQREQRGITLEEISQTTKIGSRFLHALEEDRFEQLPGGIFNKGFVRAYARSVGLDEEEAIASYLEATGIVPDKPEAQAPAPELRAEADSDGAARLPWGTLAIVLLIVALVLAVWGFYNRKMGRSLATAPGNQGNAASSSGSVAVPAVSQAGSSTSTTPTPGAPMQKPSESAAAGSKIGVKSGGASTEPISVRIQAREDCWVSIAADGREIMRGTMAAASDKSVHAAREIVVKAGNIGAVDFEFNGKKLPAQGNIGEVKTLIFDAAGPHASPSPPASPTNPIDSPPQP